MSADEVVASRDRCNAEPFVSSLRHSSAIICSSDLIVGSISIVSAGCRRRSSAALTRELLPSKRTAWSDKAAVPGVLFSLVGGRGSNRRDGAAARRDSTLLARDAREATCVALSRVVSVGEAWNHFDGVGRWRVSGGGKFSQRRKTLDVTSPSRKFAAVVAITLAVYSGLTN